LTWTDGAEEKKGQVGNRKERHEEVENVRVKTDEVIGGGGPPC
jgi:hypothetical protein